MSRRLVTPEAEIPEALRERMLNALDRVVEAESPSGDAPDAARLAAAALDRLQVVLASDGGRGAALDLLAADALLTDACAAAALGGTEELEDFTGELIDRLAELIT